MGMIRAMTIHDLDGLRQDMLAKAEEMRQEAGRLALTRPEEAEHLHRIAARLDVYMRDFLRD